MGGLPSLFIFLGGDGHLATYVGYIYRDDQLATQLVRRLSLVAS